MGPHIIPEFSLKNMRLKKDIVVRLNENTQI